MMRHCTLALVLAAVALLVASSSCAAEAKPLKVGDAAPDWSGIPGVDGNKHSLSDYKKAKLIVLVFTCNHCPVAKAYEDRLIALQKDYKSRGVQVIAACVNDRDDDRLPAMKVRAAEKGFNFPYIYDESQKIGRDYGATVTPHVFVLDQDRKVAYMGAIDDNQNPKRVKVHYLRNTLDYLLTGNSPVTKQFGCTIKWKR